MNSKRVARHTRRAKNSFIQRKARRQAYDKILIVGEGKSERFYFNDARNFHQLNTVTVQSLGKDPMRLVQSAIKEYEQSELIGDAYDMVYCVFDKDQHVEYKEAIAELNRQQPIGKWHAITSVPCFEYWLLLHFKYTTQPFNNCASIIQQLTGFLPSYSKGLDGLYHKLSDKMDKAIANAQKATIEARNNRSDNPSTLVYQVVKHLQKIEKQTLH
ncbi:RloB family protein [Oligella urethralis]|uniref:RloB family protein n=1 Tax=Oligella urethralis TaxID=90245 RepID=UPI0006615311|nr:RloB family protein [Oligella urethralis]